MSRGIGQFNANKRIIDNIYFVIQRFLYMSSIFLIILCNESWEYQVAVQESSCSQGIASLIECIEGILGRCIRGVYFVQECAQIWLITGTYYSNYSVVVGDPDSDP
jgi:hypothetical protein